MILLKCIFQIFVLYQISQIVSESKVSRPIRNWLKVKGQTLIVANVLYELISCFLCVSVWVGFILTPILFDFANYIGYTKLSWFWNGLFFSSITWFMNVWEQNKLKE